MNVAIERLATDRGVVVTVKLDGFNNANVAVDFSVPSTAVGNTEFFSQLDPEVFE
jgi:hypothetical protein